MNLTIEIKKKGCLLIPISLKGKPLYENIKAFLTRYIKKENKNDKM